MDSEGEYQLMMSNLLEPSQVSREILFQAIADREPADRITPEYFLAHYMKFVAMVIAHGKPSQDTLYTYKVNIDCFLDWCLQTARISPFKLKEKHIELYRSMLYAEQSSKTDDNYSINSVYTRITAIKAFYKAAVKQQVIETNPCIDVSAKTISINDLPFSYYEMDEIGNLVEFIKRTYPEFECKRHLACIYLMAVAGLRAVEVHRANREDINWNDFTMVIHGKGHNGRIYLDDSTAQVLLDYIDCVKRQPQQVPKVKGVTPLIVSNASNRYGTRLARSSIRWNMDKILKEAGMKKLGACCHVFRHSCATALYENTHDLRVVQDTLRHKNPQTTTRYAHVIHQLQSRPTSVLGRALDNHGKHPSNGATLH